MNKTLRIGTALCLGAIVVTAGLAYHAQWREFHPQLAAMAPVVMPEWLRPFQKAVISDLNRQVAANIIYQDGYFSGGDPPPNIGVCTDVVIRSYRAAGVDLHRMVSKDIAANPDAYHIDRPDPNIDHRRCRNLAVYFRRKAIRLPTSGAKADWEPGDIVLWDTSGGGKPDHIGVIGNRRDAQGVQTVIHHWPGHVVAETEWPSTLAVVYHFRWPPSGTQ